MAMAFWAVCLLVVMLGASISVEGVEHIVGGNAGWSSSVDFTTWASAQSFRVGDNLVFKYDDGKHKVERVNEEEYNNCNSSSNGVNSYGNGITYVALTSPGRMYFICPFPSHCAGGMKLAVNVFPNSTALNTAHRHDAFGCINQLLGSLLASTVILAFMG